MFRTTTQQNKFHMPSNAMQTQNECTDRALIFEVDNGKLISEWRWFTYASFLSSKHGFWLCHHIRNFYAQSCSGKSILFCQVSSTSHPCCFIVCPWNANHLMHKEAKLYSFRAISHIGDYNTTISNMTLSSQSCRIISCCFLSTNSFNIELAQADGFIILLKSWNVWITLNQISYCWWWENHHERSSKESFGFRWWCHEGK